MPTMAAFWRQRLPAKTLDLSLQLRDPPHLSHLSRPQLLLWDGSDATSLSQLP